MIRVFLSALPQIMTEGFELAYQLVNRRSEIKVVQAGAPTSPPHGADSTHQHAERGGACVYPGNDDWPDPGRR
jgi:hypothetical protein